MLIGILAGILHFVWAIVCAVMAKNKGKSEVAWFFLGLLIGLIAVIILACSSSDAPAPAQGEAPRMLSKGGQATPRMVAGGRQASSLDEIKKLKELLDSGLISQDEFDAKKKQILGL